MLGLEAVAEGFRPWLYRLEEGLDKASRGNGGPSTTVHAWNTELVTGCGR